MIVYKERRKKIKGEDVMLKRDIISKLKIHVILWCAAAVIFIVGIMNWHSSLVTKDYRCLDGKIINVEAVKVLQKPGYVTRYNYTIIWYDNNIYYERNVHEAIDRPDECQTKVWVNVDNTDVILEDSTSARHTAYENFGVAVILFILGILFTPKGNKKKKMSADEIESKYISSILMAVVMVISDLFMIYLYCSTISEHIYITPVLWDLIGVFTIILVISIVNIIKLKKKLR